MYSPKLQPHVSIQAERGLIRPYLLSAAPVLPLCPCPRALINQAQAAEPAKKKYYSKKKRSAFSGFKNEDQQDKEHEKEHDKKKKGGDYDDNKKGEDYGKDRDGKKSKKVS